MSPAVFELQESLGICDYCSLIKMHLWTTYYLVSSFDGFNHLIIWNRYVGWWASSSQALGKKVFVRQLIYAGWNTLQDSQVICSFVFLQVVPNYLDASPEKIAHMYNSLQQARHIDTRGKYIAVSFSLVIIHIWSLYDHVNNSSDLFMIILLNCNIIYCGPLILLVNKFRFLDSETARVQHADYHLWWNIFINAEREKIVI